MQTDYAEIRVYGRTITVPAVLIEDKTIVATGAGVKTAFIRDEMAVEGDFVHDPGSFITQLKRSALKADLFTFAQKPPAVTPRFNLPFELDNMAAIRVSPFQNWWENLPQESRKNVRRAAKRGVIVRVAPFDDEFARGIHKICNEAPVRQGRRFWHYGKDFETVRREHATYLERSEFIGAYWKDELIGFIKMVYVDNNATLFHILAMNKHYDKRPMNALVAKAVEVCDQKKLCYLIYGQFTYGNKDQSSLAEFKRRNGFEQINFPRYYVPLTLKGRCFISLGLHKGINGLLPSSVLGMLWKARAWFYRVLTRANPAADITPDSSQCKAGVAQR